VAEQRVVEKQKVGKETTDVSDVEKAGSGAMCKKKQARQRYIRPRSELPSDTNVTNGKPRLLLLQLDTEAIDANLAKVWAKFDDKQQALATNANLTQDGKAKKQTIRAAVQAQVTTAETAGQIVVEVHADDKISQTIIIKQDW
jgi:hypothetical protein